VRIWRTSAAIAAVALIVTACGGDDDTADGATSDDGTTSQEEMAGEGGAMTGTVVAAGSSTVLPVAEYVLEGYAMEQPDVDASYTSIGSGGGFERLCVETDVDLSGASRQIRDEEAQACADNGVEFLELQFGVDALTMVTAAGTPYLECMSTDDIVATFGPDGASTWDEVNPDWPAEPVEIFAPDTDSGTYGFMVEDVMGLEESRQDYTASADDNVIVQGIQSAQGSWGFFGLAYYEANADGLQAVAHENSSGECVLPSVETAQDGSYELTRPLYIYVDVEALTSKPEVADFVQYFLEDAPNGIDAVGYVNDDARLAESVAAVEEALAG
jgi:phosphate transport system substrate-binding protein